MKTKITILTVILSIIAVTVFFSCDNPISLGTKLDLAGPVVNFTSPVPRKAVKESFLLEGTVKDNSGVKKLILNVEKNKEQLPCQWRYLGSYWEVTVDSGKNWTSLKGGKWQGSNNVTWSIPVSLTINGKDPENGEYKFYAQAWDSGNISDDNSNKTLILIVDNDPPKVSISRPSLYDRNLYNFSAGAFDNTSDEGKEINTLLSMTDHRSPEYINKFQTNSFSLQWGIEDNFNIWSFDLRFYTMDVEIDEDKKTPLPDDYVYRVYQNTMPIPESPSPSDYVKPNGTIKIPALDGPTGPTENNGELKKSLTSANTPLRIVAVCYDAAGNITQEKTLGFFIYWAEADIPWITFSGDVKDPDYYNSITGVSTNNDFAHNVEKAFMVYPGVAIKAVAFHAQGVKDVTYTIKKIVADDDGKYKSPYSANTLTNEGLSDKGKTLPNSQSARQKYDWEFVPEPRSAYYVVEATALSTTGKKNTTPVKGIFQVKDITFPDFTSVEPPVLEPLYMHIKNNAITISGIVSDATAIDSLCLVWINPQSKNFAAQSQLDYFRDINYAGWTTALGRPVDGTYGTEGNYDPDNPNKVWRLKVTKSTDYTNGINPKTQRVEFKFSKSIPLTDLDIGKIVGGSEVYLKSQVFLLRAANPNPRVTVITHTPQGDEKPPVIKITNAVINNSKTLLPGEFGEIDKFGNGNTITINGKWEEDSVGTNFLDFDTYLKNNFVITVNETRLTNITFPTRNGSEGTWRAVATVKTATTAANDVPLANLKNTLTISANLKDIGGNQADDGASWLVKSDTLRLVRISSENADQSYKATDTIEIFIEFNKPVSLKSGRSGNPVLNLNLTGGGTTTATYKNDQNIQNTRQYFTYTVQTGQSTTSSYLDVTGLSGVSGTNYWTSDTYPFTWVATSGTSTEEIRVTNGNSGHTETSGLASVTGNSYNLRRIPIAGNTADLTFTLANGKNISIDTQAPTVSKIYTNTKAGHYALNAEIDINVEFSEAVKINESSPPQLQLTLNNATRTTNGTPRVNDRTVTFTYKVVTNDTTEDNKVIVSGFTGGTVTDIAGTSMAAMNLSPANRTLNGGGSANNGNGIYINTVVPSAPTFRALTANSNTAIISNTVSNTPITAESAGISKNIQNYYGDELWFAIMPNGSGYKVEYLEYSLDGTNWKRIVKSNGTDNIDGTPFKQDIVGSYNVTVRQTDKAGNTSLPSNPVILNWDPGTLVTRIDSSSSNGTYTNNGTRTDTINITVYFRKPITVIGNKIITLNAINEGSIITVNTITSSTTTANTSQLSFDYVVGTKDNTPTGQKLDVTELNIEVTDAQVVKVPTNYIKVPTDAANLLKSRKDITVQTGALERSTGPTCDITRSGDEGTGTIKFTFNRDISKLSTGNITVKQKTTNDSGVNIYRLPAVLTEEQVSRYKSARNFDDYYTKGTNGFDNAKTVMDTSTKYVLNYTQSALVTPNNGSSNKAEQMAYDFWNAESISMPVSSQDVTISGNTLTINLTGSNTLQVLGADYIIDIPAGLVQDSLSFKWPSSATQFNYKDTSINRPFVRVDKKINKDLISEKTGSLTMPYLMADFSNLITTTARFDCRTPDSIVLYKYTGQTHNATGATTNYGNTANANPTSNSYWRNGDNPANSNIADKADYLAQQAIADNRAADPAGDEEGFFAINTAPITVGTTASNPGTATENVDGYIWRVGIKSRSSTATSGGAVSALYDDIAFRTVLTYEMSGIAVSGYGQIFSAGDQLWVRGGDAVAGSSVPGFPLNWQDDYDKLNKDKKRAGARLLKMVSVGTNFNTASVWRWVTWEINVRTYHDILLVRSINSTTPDMNEAWQYGPRQWAYQRGGWTSRKDDYTLWPGKHRWLRITNSGYTGGSIDFTLNLNYRGAQTVSIPDANK